MFERITGVFIVFVGLSSCSLRPDLPSSEMFAVGATTTNAAMPGKFAGNSACPVGAAQAISAQACRSICQADPGFQKFLTCINPPKCIDLSFLVPTCSPFAGACSCDALLTNFQCRQCSNGDVKLSLPDRKVYGIEVVSAFPVSIDASGKSQRVCGAAVDNATLAANGIELVNNFVSANLVDPPCGAEDHDYSIKEGEMVQLHTFSAQGSAATIGPQNFKLNVCSQVDHNLPAPACLPGGGEFMAASLSYKSLSPRCDPKNENSRVNVAVIVDNSGSTAGLVDKDSLEEEAKDNFSYSGWTKNIASDFIGVRVDAVDQFVQQLNARDRAIAYYFDEDGVHVAAADDRHCQADMIAGKLDQFCSQDSECKADDSCSATQDQANNSYNGLSFGASEVAAFGANTKTRADIHTSLDTIVRASGSGRAPIWAALYAAYKFLSSSANDGGSGLTVADNRHIVIVTDGPDTCCKSEDFNYAGFASLPKSKAGKCREPCAAESPVEFGNQPYLALIELMKKANWPVHIHVIQFQSPGYKAPDARLQQLACASDGTYQFINSEQVNKAQNNNLLSKALTQALNRVRNGLSGAWRSTYKLLSLQDKSVTKYGSIQAIDGSLDVTAAKFTSLELAKTNFFDWRFAFSSSEDRRLLVRVPCASNADCGGDDDCAPKHCSSGGVCLDAQAPDLMPCTLKDGGSGKCCKGSCAASGGSCSCTP